MAGLRDPRFLQQNYDAPIGTYPTAVAEFDAAPMSKPLPRNGMFIDDMRAQGYDVKIDKPLPRNGMFIDDMRAQGYDVRIDKPLPRNGMFIDDMRAQGYDVRIDKPLPRARIDESLLRNYKPNTGVADTAARALQVGPSMRAITLANAAAAATPGEIGLRQANDLASYLRAGNRNVTGNQYIAVGEDIGGALVNPNYQPRSAPGQLGAAIGSGLHKAKRYMGW